jgi:hypothetical protein
MSTDEPDHGGVITFHSIADGKPRVSPGSRTDGDRPRRFRRNVADKADMRRFEEFIEKRGRETDSWRGDVDHSGN